MAYEKAEAPELTEKFTVADALLEIESYGKKFDGWEKKSKNIVDRYRDERTIINSSGVESTAKSKFNILWSNVQTQLPAYYSRTPKSECERRYKDSDQIGAVMGEIAERMGNHFGSDRSFDRAMRKVVKDVLLPGRGTAWARYDEELSEEPEVDQLNQPILDEAGQPVFKKANQECKTDFVLWKDFGHQVAESWDMVDKVWRKVAMTKQQVAQKLGAKASETLSYGNLPDQYKDSDKAEAKKKRHTTEVYEMWCKEEGKVYFFSKENSAEFLKVIDDPLHLKEFYPTPFPLYASDTTDSLVPIPDFEQYKDLADQLDDLSRRRRAVLRAIRVCGALNGGCPELQKLFEDTCEDEGIPVAAWAAFAQNGGLKGNVDFWPIDMYIQALQVMNAEFAILKQEIYEITGLAEIIRGYSAPSKTATAVQTESQFAQLRYSDRQKDVQRYARDLLEIQIEIGLEHFSDDKIAAICVVDAWKPEQQQLFLPALEKLRNDKLRCYRIEIETDSMVQLDQQKTQEQRTQTAEVVGEMISNVAAGVMQAPELGPALKELAMFTINSFPASRQLSHSIEQSLDALVQRVLEQGPPPPPGQEGGAPKGPSPEELQMKAELEHLKIENERMKIELQGQKQEQDAALKTYEIDEKMKLERDKLTENSELQATKIAGDMLAKASDIHHNAANPPRQTNGGTP